MICVKFLAKIGNIWYIAEYLLILRLQQTEKNEESPDSWCL